MSEEQQVEQIDKELVKQSLYNLGKTFNNARHAYLSLNLSNNSL
jgi:sensor c-di-GMP phosphodiesterase-like protein